MKWELVMPHNDQQKKYTHVPPVVDAAVDTAFEGLAHAAGPAIPAGYRGIMPSTIFLAGKTGVDAFVNHHEASANGDPHPKQTAAVKTVLEETIPRVLTVLKFPAPET